MVEYLIPRPGNFPHDPTVAKDGSFWYTDQRNSHIGRLDPETAKVVDLERPQVPVRDLAGLEWRLPWTD